PVIKKEYGQKCSDPNFSIKDLNCVKVDDKTRLNLTFDKGKVGAGKTIDVSIDSIVNAAGTKINSQPQKIGLKVYPVLRFNLGKVELDTVTLCSNVPLDAPQSKDIRSHISANLDFETFSWWQSRKKTYERDSSPCVLGEFVTSVSVGLMPESDYRLEFSVNDVFGQAGKDVFQFRTGPMDAESVEIFPMQGSYSVTTPDKLKLAYGAKNITEATVRICKLDALSFWREKERLQNWSQSRKDPLPHGCLESKETKVNLPARFWLNSYFNVTATDGFAQSLGHYIVSVTNPLYRDYQKNQAYVTTFLTVTNMAAAQKTINPSTYISSDETPLSADQLASLTNLYWISDIKTLNAVGGAAVKVYDDKGQNVLVSGTTDDSGIAKLVAVAGAGPTIVDNGADSAIVDRGDSSVGWAWSAKNVKKAYIYTDRPIYRPGDKVSIKGILRLGYDGNYQSWGSGEVTLEVKNPRWEASWSQTIKLDDFGTVDAEMPIDAAAPLGTWRVCVKDTYLCGTFDVKEYVPAAFKVDARSSKDEYVSKDNVKIDVDAQYYFGVPVANASVEYTVSSQNYYFNKYRGGNYDFGFYEDCGSGYCYGDRFIGRGTLDLDANGKGTIEQVVDLQKLAGDSGFANSRIIVFDITARNSMGQSVSTQKSVIVHAGSFYIGAKTEPYFAAKNQEIKLLAKSVGADGKVTNDAGQITATVYRVEWVFAKRLEAGGNYNYDWTKNRTAVKTIKMDGSGDYSEKTSLDKEGEYEIDFTAAKNNNTVMTRGNIYIYGEGIASVRPYNDTTLDIKAPKTDLEAGQTGQLIIESPFARARALIAIERGKIFDYKVVDINGSLYNYEFPAKEEWGPNVFVSVLLQSSDPAVKYGSKEFNIDSKRGSLDVQVKPDKQSYQPGEKVKLNITARDGNGRPVEAQFSLAVVDVSVLALAGNPKRDPVVFFYDGFPLAVSTSSNIKNILQVFDAPSKGGGGADNAAEQSSDNVRGDFRDTALWRGSVKTDSAGVARIEFDLPDNLTTWEAEAIGVTRDTKLGAGYAEFMAKKDVMVVPLKPRFIIPGDSFFVGSQVFNQSSDQKKISVQFSSNTLKFVGNDKKLTVDLKAGESKTVYFGVEAPLDQTKGIHTFEINADGGSESFSDAVRLTIPVQPNLTYEATATAGHSTGNAAEAIYLPGNVANDRGGLTVNSSATLAVFLSNGLNYLVGYPYGCTEQISSRLRAMATVIAGLNVPNLEDKFQLKKVWTNGREYTATELVNVGLVKVYNNQNANGGFGLWDSREPAFYPTLEAVRMLLAPMTRRSPLPR
ncbi:MAG: MG2 domain-containing protein, partial [Candidatus Pacebacteria bacterium]|nr:MG2 domain-containing protein [Candidatus Paceibacterota bacterium]